VKKYLASLMLVTAFTCEPVYEETLKLIAEYPTWQEAVNSKEFNDAAED
jgi:hypothetical protein